MAEHICVPTTVLEGSWTVVGRLVSPSVLIPNTFIMSMYVCMYVHQ